MKMSDWELLHTLYLYQNMTQTASALFLTQSAVSKRLQAIETELGILVANRNKRGVVFTPEGEYLAVKSTQILDIMQEIREHLTYLKDEPSGILSIGAPNSMARFSLPTIMQSYKKLHPNINFDITTDRSSKISLLVEQGILDLGFVKGDFPFSGEKYLFDTEYAYLASTTPLDIRQLPGQPYITYFKDAYTQNLLEQWWSEYFFSPLPQGLVVQNGDICKEMILKGLGFSIFFVKEYMEGYPEFCTPLYHKDGSPLSRPAWLIYHEDLAKKSMIQDFITCVTGQ